MQLPGFLDIAVTLVATFMLVSLLCTTLNELVSSLLKTRAVTLHRTVSALIDDDRIRAAFFDHGLIKSLGKGSSSGKNGANPSYIDGRTFADALLGTLSPEAPIAGVAEVRDSLGKLSDGKLKEALLAAVASAETSATEMRDEIALWFDGTMDRLTGYYTRYMKVLSLLVGLVVAAGLNIDAIELAKASWQENVRSAAMSIVESYKAPPGVDCSGDAAIDCLIGNIADTTRSLKGLPIGWENLQLPAGQNPILWGLTKLIGWIITALAASVGAPFWFDILQNVMSLRGAGTKRQAPEEEDKAK
jgi:hypothetical protein